MSPQPTPDLDTEPLVFFHPTLAGLAPLGKIQPVTGNVPFDEEPAIWAEVSD